MEGCPDCFLEQGTINEKFQAAINEAQKLANMEQKKVAVFVEGQGFSFCIITEGLPPFTRCTVEPVQ